jgi:hypothetical protein
MGDVSDNFSFASNDFRALAAFFCSLVTPEQPRPLSVGAHGEPRARVPHLVASRLPRHYHFRALIQSFQAVAEPFPGDSILRPGSLALRSQRPKRLGSKDRRSADYAAAWDLRNLFRHPASAAPPISRDRRRGWTRATSFGSARRLPAVSIGVLRTRRIQRDSNSISFVFNGLQGGKVSLPSQPAPRARRLDRCVALAKASIQETACRRATSDRERAARLRGLGDLLARTTTRLAGARQAAAGFLGEHGHGGFSSSEVERGG